MLSAHFTKMEVHTCPLANVGKFWEESWPGLVKFCKEYVRDICFGTSAPELYFPTMLCTKKIGIYMKMYLNDIWRSLSKGCTFYLNNACLICRWYNYLHVVAFCCSEDIMQNDQWDLSTIVGSDNGLSPGRHQAIIWTNAMILLIGPFGNLNRNSNIFIDENTLENVVCQIGGNFVQGKMS